MAKKQLRKLTLQDYIDLEKIIKSGAGDFEQQTFLLSRYYDLELDHIKAIDIRLINIMMSYMNEYIEKKSISPEEINDEIDRIQNKVKKETKNGKHEGIEDRFGILDL